MGRGEDGSGLHGAPGAPLRVLVQRGVAPCGGGACGGGTGAVGLVELGLGVARGSSGLVGRLGARGAAGAGCQGGASDPLENERIDFYGVVAATLRPSHPKPATGLLGAARRYAKFSQVARHFVKSWSGSLSSPPLDLATVFLFAAILHFTTWELRMEGWKA